MTRNFLNNLSGTGDNISLGIGGFLLDVRILESETLTTEITENIVESGAVVNDYLILKPIKYKIEGWVSDVRLNVSNIQRALNNSSNRYGAIVGYLPVRVRGSISRAVAFGQDITNTINKINAVISNIEKAFSIDKTIDIQAQFKTKIRDLHLNKDLFKATIAGENVKNLCITSSTFERNNEVNATRYILEIQVFRFSSDITSEIVKISSVSGAEVLNNTGTVNTKAVSKDQEASILYKLLNQK